MLVPATLTEQPDSVQGSRRGPRSTGPRWLRSRVAYGIPARSRGPPDSDAPRQLRPLGVPVFCFPNAAGLEHQEHDLNAARGRRGVTERRAGARARVRNTSFTGTVSLPFYRPEPGDGIHFVDIRLALIDDVRPELGLIRPPTTFPKLPVAPPVLRIQGVVSIAIERIQPP